VSDPAATNDLFKLALVLLQAGGMRNARQSIKSLARTALLQTVAALCVIGALGCALGALLIYATPILGGAGALLVGAGVFAIIALSVFGLAQRAGRRRTRLPTIGSGADAALAEAASLFKQHTGLALAAALLAGVFVGGAP
jgi:hypothetical protein